MAGKDVSGWEIEIFNTEKKEKKKEKKEIFFFSLFFSFFSVVIKLTFPKLTNHYLLLYQKK